MPPHHAGDEMGNQQEFNLNVKHNGDMLNLNEAGDAVRNWAFANVGIAYRISANVSGSDIVKHALQWGPCSASYPADCYQELPGRKINDIDMHFYEIKRVGKGDSDIKSIYVFFRAAGNPYWQSFCSHHLDFDRYWPDFEIIIRSFSVKNKTR